MMRGEVSVSCDVTREVDEAVHARKRDDEAYEGRTRLSALGLRRPSEESAYAEKKS